MSPAVRTAVVTIAHRRMGHLERQHRSLTAGLRPDAYVVVAMSDPELESWSPAGAPHPVVLRGPEDPRGLPLAAARNAGFARAVADGAEVVIGLDVDCLVDARTVAAYVDAVRAEPDVLWSGPATYLMAADSGGDPLEVAVHDDPHPARPAPPPGDRWHDADPDLFWSLSFAVHADAWRAVGGFCEEYAGYGAEDTDFARLWVRSGRRLGWVGGARTYHQHHDTEDPPVQHLDDILRNGATFARRWGTWPMGGWLEAFRERGLVERDAGGCWTRTVARTRERSLR